MLYMANSVFDPDMENIRRNIRALMDTKKIIGSYTLRSKDIPLVSFDLTVELQQALGMVQRKYQVHIRQTNPDAGSLFPRALRDNLTDDALQKWIEHRKAPKNRQFVDHLLDSIEDRNNPFRYMDVSHALSLNDALWITNDAVPAKWADWNLYHHPFNEILAYVAFTGYSTKVSGVVTSPELTSSGTLKKCWSNRDDGIYLIKGDDLTATTDGRSQAVMEYYASQVAEAMKIPYVPYDLELFRHQNGRQEVVCKSQLFTSEDVGFVPAYDFFLDHNLPLDETDPADLLLQEQMATIYGMEAYQDLMVFDVLIGNRDRHLGNFGYLIDNNTGKYFRPAPVFDNGFSLLVGGSRQDLEEKNFLYYISHIIQGKWFDFPMQAKLFAQPRHQAVMRKLEDFTFQKHPDDNLTDSILKQMNRFVQYQARLVLQTIRGKRRSTMDLSKVGKDKGFHP